MSRTVYEESYLIISSSIEPYIKALLPLLRIYGVSNRREESYVYEPDKAVVISKVELIGDPQGAHLKYDFSDDDSDGEAALNGYKRLRGVRLVHSITGEKLDLSIEIARKSNILYREILLRFEGEPSEIDKFKEAIRPVLKKSGLNYFQPDSDIPARKILEMVIESQSGYYDYYMDEIDWDGILTEEYYFQIPAKWIIDSEYITKGTAAKLLRFIKERRFRFLGSRTKLRYEIIDFKPKFISMWDWEKKGRKTIFRVKTSGEIKQIEMPE